MIGCGAIARQYLDTTRRLDAIEIVAAADRVPARAKFLRSPRAEYASCVDIVRRLAMARPEIGVTLEDRADGTLWRKE